MKRVDTKLWRNSTYRVKSRHDEIKRYNISTKTWDWIVDNNRIEYTYSGDCSGYPTYASEEEMPTSYQFWSEAYQLMV